MRRMANGLHTWDGASTRCAPWLQGWVLQDIERARRKDFGGLLHAAGGHHRG